MFPLLQMWLHPLLLCLLVLLCATSTLDHEGPAPASNKVDVHRPFRCRRSMDQLYSLKPKHTPIHKNCFFGALEVMSASLQPTLKEGNPAFAVALVLEPERDVRMMRYKVSLHSYEKGRCCRCARPLPLPLALAVNLVWPCHCFCW